MRNMAIADIMQRSVDAIRKRLQVLDPDKLLKRIPESATYVYACNAWFVLDACAVCGYRRLWARD